MILQLSSSFQDCFDYAGSLEFPYEFEDQLTLIPGLGRSPGEGKGYPLQYSGLESQTQLGGKMFGLPWWLRE